MKKAGILVIILILGLTFTSSKPCQLNKFSLTIGAGMKSFSEELYKEVYGNNSISYNFELAIIIFGEFELFLHSDYFSTDGQLTFSKETTTLKIIPVEIGVRYLIKVDKSCNTKIFPYLGVGGGYYLIEETNTIGSFKQEKFGFFAEGGLRFYFSQLLFIDTKIKYVTLEVKNDENEALALGGISYMGGIGLSF